MQEPDEKAILEHSLKTNIEFIEFYKEERPKIGSIHWIRDPNILEGIVAYADVLKGEIHYRSPPVSNEDAFTIAHEIMHLVRYKETDLLKIGCMQHRVLAIYLMTMFEDPIVDSLLQEKYKFDLVTSYRTAMNYCRKKIKDEAPDLISRLINGFDLANYMLKWDSIRNQSALNDWFEYLKWYEERRPNSYKIGSDTAKIARSIGIETLEKQKIVATILIDKYDMRYMRVI